MAREDVNANTVGDPPLTSEIGCSLGAWGKARIRKLSNRYNFGCMTDNDSMFAVGYGLSATSCPMKM